MTRTLTNVVLILLVVLLVIVVIREARRTFFVSDVEPTATVGAEVVAASSEVQVEVAPTAASAEPTAKADPSPTAVVVAEPTDTPILRPTETPLPIPTDTPVPPPTTELEPTLTPAGDPSTVNGLPRRISGDHQRIVFAAGEAVLAGSIDYGADGEWECEGGCWHPVAPEDGVAVSAAINPWKTEVP